MDIVTTSQVEKVIGKNNFFKNNTKLLCTQYAAGIKAFDGIIDPESLFSATIPTNIIEHDKGIEISIMYKFKLHRVALPFDKVISAAIEDKGQIIEQKDKSVIGRAFIGGITLGPLGAVIGGMTGLGKTDRVLYSPDLLFTILFNDDEHEEKTIVFTCKQSDKNRLWQQAGKIFKSKLINVSA